MVLNNPNETWQTRNLTRSDARAFSEQYVPSMENPGYTISNTSFDTDNVMIYDVKGIYGFFIQLFNPSETLMLTYKIDFATSNPSDPTQLPADAWFELVSDKTVAAGSWSNATLDGGANISEFVRATPKITFIRVSMHLSGAGSETITGHLTGV